MPRASPQPKTMSRALKVTPIKAIIKTNKHVGVRTRKAAIKTTTTQCVKMSRKQLIKSLSELGILTPSSLNNDTLRLLYDTNVTQAQNKQKTGPSNSSSSYNDTHDEGDEMNTAVSDDDSEETSTGLKFLQALQQEQTDDSDDCHDEYSEEGQHKANNIPFKRKHKALGVNAKQFIPAKEVRNQAGKAFTLLSTPIAEEQFKLGSDGLVGHGDTDIETVPKGLRKAIIEGYNVNLVRLLLPRDNKKYSRDDDEDEDKNVYLKQKTDPRLDKNLTILEFILAFIRYLNIICEVFPQRRRELTAYMSGIIRLSSRFGHPYFYDYHRLFSEKAETLLQTRHILVDWSKRDHDIYFNVFSGLRPMVCELCRSPDHATSFCEKILDRNDLIEKMLSNNLGRASDSAPSSILYSRRVLGSDDSKNDTRSTCKFHNGAGFGKCSTKLSFAILASCGVSKCPKNDDSDLHYVSC